MKSLKQQLVMKCFICLILVSFMRLAGFSQTLEIRSFDTLCEHRSHWDEQGRLLGWYRPEIPGAAYDLVTRLASVFLLNIPEDPKTGLKMYHVTCCFQGPHLHDHTEEDAPDGIAPGDWMHNPACVNAGFVHSFAMKYYPYTGDVRFLGLVEQMLDYQLAHGTTPAAWAWGNVPYASADPFSPDYAGASRWEEDGMRGDGRHGIEPDKVGELGYAYLRFYEISREERFLAASLSCADALARHIRPVPTDNSSFTMAETDRSPWPFRVHAETGEVISEYCANVVEPIKLFDELIRLKLDIRLSAQQVQAYRQARQVAWDWLYSKHGPMKTYIWSQYFEDIPNDEERTNRNQVTPMEWAKYLIENPGLDNRMDVHIPALIHWVLSTFGHEELPAIKEQTWCYEAMGSHSSRFGATCAMWYERTGDTWYREQAYRHLNYATYMTYSNGVVAVGHKWPSSWFSDGYGDYVRHFLDAMAAVPEWAPASENHLLRSSTAIQSITYDGGRINFTSYDSSGTAKLKLVRKPSRVTVNEKIIGESESIHGHYTLENLVDGAVLVTLQWSSGNAVGIIL